MKANEFADIIVELEKRGFINRTVKTLTDDEIDSIAMSCEVGDRFNQAGDEIYTRDFARAILRKASE